ncbi:hypothetical protein SeMB42_g05253 [Synchytrium endobioticum]|uniref:Hexosyltransferase n=1 Tax=Synchytrium endobioticum TaxID=286115 RepID=A0A507CSY2_9FUNG|nr:hypothetical protein SeMB42_g05253 [Synchytrium endobioticum]TPX42287.1 hypothetical protein SeLEV6574_g05673 [Synchytrium endobioticum]
MVSLLKPLKWAGAFITCIAILVTLSILIASGSRICRGSDCRNWYKSISPAPANGGTKTVLVGIFTTPEKYDRRALIRSTYLNLNPSDRVHVYFILGKPDKTEWATLLSLEDALYHDIMVLDVPENMNDGKTYAYFSALARKYSSTDYMYAAKVDDDVWLHLPNLETLLRVQGADKRVGAYIGRHVHGTGFMAGMGYMLSWDLVDWIGKDPYPRQNAIGQEDAVLAGWLHEKNKIQHFWSIEGADQFYDEPESGQGWAHNYSTQHTIMVHRLKRTDWFLKASRHFLSDLLPAHIRDNHHKM